MFQVEYLTKLSIGISITEQRILDQAPRTRWEVSQLNNTTHLDLDELKAHNFD